MRLRENDVIITSQVSLRIPKEKREKLLATLERLLDDEFFPICAAYLEDVDDTGSVDIPSRSEA